MTEKKTDSSSFEEAYSRLEIILEELSSGELSLEKSLKLYEEADSLISKCSQKLNNAEQKIQTLIKNREGQVAMNHAAEPKLEAFTQYNSNDVPF